METQQKMTCFYFFVKKWKRTRKMEKWKRGPKNGTLEALGALANRRQNEFKDAQFQHFLALAAEVDKMRSRRLDLSIFLPWLQKSTK
jgi:hypothetical protein